ncbi:MAG: glycosyltransferase family 4 protein [Acidobacteriota bacterium]
MSKPLRLLWLIDSLNVGGAESLALTFARHADPARFELHVCTLGSVNGNPLEKDLRAAGIRTTNLGARNLRDLRAFRRLLRFVREHRIQLVHAHLTYSAIWAAVLSRLTRIPAVASLHVRVESTQDQERDARGRRNVNRRDRLMSFVLNRWAARVVLVSAALRDQYLSRRRLDPAKAIVVHNGIEIERFARDRAATRARLGRELDLPDDVPLMVTVSVLRPGKGIEVLLDALRDIPRAYLIVVGDGPMREEWQRTAEQLGVADRLRWAGFRRDVDAFLAGCDVMVHPSLDDAFPTVLLEALAAGLPVIASRVGGIPEIVLSGVTGELVPPGDSMSLAATTSALLADSATLRQMSAASLQRARQFSTAAWIERLAVVYAEAGA